MAVHRLGCSIIILMAWVVVFSNISFLIFAPIILFFKNVNYEDKYLRYLEILVGPSSLACLWIIMA
jgi:ABC-type multidrug transport system permease subunit